MRKPITLSGKNKIEEELDRLIRIDREENKGNIVRARALGDLKENADYHAAKEKQSMIEGRIQFLQGVLADCEVIDVKTIKEEKVVFGATVSLQDIEQDIMLTYQIVSDVEANIKEGRISYNSPIGKTLIGKMIGDEIIVKAPRGDKEYLIESIQYVD